MQEANGTVQEIDGTKNVTPYIRFQQLVAKLQEAIAKDDRFMITLLTMNNALTKEEKALVRAYDNALIVNRGHVDTANQERARQSFSNAFKNAAVKAGVSYGY